jgi:hypothetical protein
VPLDPEHERESLAALTELVRLLLERQLAADEQVPSTGRPPLDAARATQIRSEYF